MIEQIKKFYQHCDTNHCHKEFENSFYLHDHNNSKCEATSDSNNATCLIETSDNNKVDFIAIDECLISESNIKKCDALVAKEKVVWFIELKEVNWSINTSLNVKKRRNARLKAVKQLASTINDFKSKGIDFQLYTVAGLISFPPFALSNPTSLPSTSSQARILEFVNLCGYSELYEGNHIVL
ncbi:hypothetical protein [uncultured Maribacter sp.]|uniref:hypothetical protein n=1 Tax=uncultured Maribacter sp. TaxID=431308 RepID=UPI00262CFE9F|nr:hypothetical protein [uncultured Maribacter sp.]